MATSPYEWPSQPARSSSHNWLWTALAVVIGITIGRLIVWSPAGLNPQADPHPVTARGSLAEFEKTTIDVFKEASPSVVHINTLVNRRADFFSRKVSQVAEGSGSGIVWDT